MVFDGFTTPRLGLGVNLPLEVEAKTSVHSFTTVPAWRLWIRKTVGGAVMHGRAARECENIS
jgi:hypothetical protein